MATTEVTLKMQVVGLERVVDGLHRAAAALSVPRERLLSMGWTPQMADNLLAEVGSIIVTELMKEVRVEPVPDA